ncbi:hypothetical protein SZN_10653 [Streptomyces zinciresistens K42]|uniref:Uncharacterized protein n=1 Tax=Streptomyces zinciresistens K42 TaxID=700597 RepID=G2G9F0_9ACTN|nr:hypothetical protein [Streptomyces zinciresistens]EGX59865.1 hypothetical protein SZN_10653 [Streptomyces zinciresistens K42]
MPSRSPTLPPGDSRCPALWNNGWNCPDLLLSPGAMTSTSEPRGAATPAPRGALRRPADLAPTLGVSGLVDTEGGLLDGGIYAAYREADRVESRGGSRTALLARVANVISGR